MEAPAPDGRLAWQYEKSGAKGADAGEDVGHNLNSEREQYGEVDFWGEEGDGRMVAGNRSEAALRASGGGPKRNSAACAI